MSSGSALRPIVKIPKLIYGTAWKKSDTAALVHEAIVSGFRGIDTACQPKHYNEKGVGEAIQKLFKQGIVKRDELFIQTKFTPIGGQDPNQVPYDPKLPLSQQVAQSFVQSKINLGIESVDSLVLHSPLQRWDDLVEVWRAMELVHREGGTKLLGISNCYDLKLLKSLYDAAEVKPKVVQNRFYRESHFDSDLRVWCREKEITYQSFWSLTANPHLLSSVPVQKVAKTHGKTEAQIFFRFLSHLGIVPLTGTRSPTHMKEDLAIFEFELSPAEIKEIEALLGN
jgi:diketogulonate reductase-like aldo/keto reductase